MRTFRVTILEMPSCRHLEYVYVTLPDWGQKGAYTQRVSFNAFFHGMKERNRTKTRLYVERDVLFSTLDEKGVPQREIDSMWDFYKYIGYDWKKNKYVN